MTREQKIQALHMAAKAVFKKEGFSCLQLRDAIKKVTGKFLDDDGRALLREYANTFGVSYDTVIDLLPVEERYLSKRTRILMLLMFAEMQ